MGSRWNASRYRSMPRSRSRSPRKIYTTHRKSRSKSPSPPRRKTAKHRKNINQPNRSDKFVHTSFSQCNNGGDDINNNNDLCPNNLRLHDDDLSDPPDWLYSESQWDNNWGLGKRAKPDYVSSCEDEVIEEDLTVIKNIMGFSGFDSTKTKNEVEKLDLLGSISDRRAKERENARNKPLHLRKSYYNHHDRYNNCDRERDSYSRKISRSSSHSGRKRKSCFRDDDRRRERKL